MFFLFYDPENAPDYGASLIRLTNILDIARDFVPEVSTDTLATFLIVCSQGAQLAGLTKTFPQLAKERGIPYSRLMRQLDLLSDGTPSAPGHKLLDKIIDPRSKRNRKYIPSQRGDLLIRKMIAAIDGSAVKDSMLVNIEEI